LEQKSIKDLGEFGLIEELTQEFSNSHPNTIKGVGDDAAVIKRGDKAVVISTDMLVEGIHFDMMYNPLMHLGYKAVVVNLSDIYAMNAVPTHITVSLALSSKFDTAALKELYKGIKKACDFYNVDLIGGDTTSSLKGMVISVTAYGEADEADIVYRSGAKNGDVLCVTGDLGAAYLGLQILEREKRLYLDNPGVQPDLNQHQYVIERQLKPEACRDAIDYFKKSKLKPTAMIDISDGLSSDLMHICKQSGVGAHVEEAKVPMLDETQTLAIDFRLDPITCALSGGEDYELLFTVAPEDLEKIRYMPDAAIIGEINEAKDGITLHTSGGNIFPLKAQGWNHFE